MIVTPDALGFVRDKPDKVCRRNLILIAKVLQNLSNGLLFGEKEEFMTACNAFIAENMDRLADYWDVLVDVNLEEELSGGVESMQSNSAAAEAEASSRPVSISLNQIFVVHTLCAQHAERLAPDAADPLRRVLSHLPAQAPEPVASSENLIVPLAIGAHQPAIHASALFVNPHLTGASSSSSSVSASSVVSAAAAVVAHVESDVQAAGRPSVYGDHSAPERDARKSLAEAAIALSPLLEHFATDSAASGSDAISAPEDGDGAGAAAASTAAASVSAPTLIGGVVIDCSHLLAFLSSGERAALGLGDTATAALAYSAKAHLIAAHAAGVLPPRQTFEAAADAFVIDAGAEAAARPAVWEALSNRLAMVQTAALSIDEHHAYLASRLALYRQYLDNARYGHAQGGAQPASAAASATSSASSSSTSSSSSSSLAKPRRTEPVRLKHKELEAMGLVAHVDPEVRFGKTYPSIHKGISKYRDRCAYRPSFSPLFDSFSFFVGEWSSKSDLKAISYIFTPMDGGRTKVEVFYTKFISINVCRLNHVMLCACCSLASCWINF